LKIFYLVGACVGAEHDLRVSIYQLRASLITGSCRAARNKKTQGSDYEPRSKLDDEQRINKRSTQYRELGKAIRAATRLSSNRGDEDIPKTITGD